MQALTFQASEGAKGRRLDQVALEALGEDFSRSRVKRLIEEGHITLGGRPAKPSAKVSPGQAIEIKIPRPRPSRLIPMEMDLDIVFEDDDLIVINKPAGVVVHPSPGHSRGTLVHGLLAHCAKLSVIGGEERPGIVHRLDKDTSGVMVAAKGDRAHRSLAVAFAAGRVKKQYLALVWGRPPSRGFSDAGIGRHPRDRKRMSSKGRHTKPAHSSWRVTRRYGDMAALLRVEIATGRTHQIRVHLSEAGHPVVGDSVYGGSRKKRLPPGPPGEAIDAAGRQLLHSAILAFSHPLTGEPLGFAAPLPGDFRRVLLAFCQGEA